MRQTPITARLSTKSVERELAGVRGAGSLESVDLHPVSTLDDKIVVVVDGATGFGRELALRFAEKGASIAITYTENEFEYAKDTLHDIERCGARGGIFEIEPDDNEDFSLVFDEISDYFGGLDILIVSRSSKEQAAVWRQTPRHQLAIIQAALPYLDENGCVLSAGPLTENVKEPNKKELLEERLVSAELARAMRERRIRVNHVTKNDADTYLYLASEFGNL